MMATLAELQALLPGARLVGDGATPIGRVHSDTRTLQGGDLFVALKGERFDAHDFLAAARDAGAAAALAERGLEASGLAGLEVADSGAALQELAAAWRARHRLPLIAVTGSNGKTTVTQMIAGILRAWRGDAALATEGNLNNHIGVPLTLLRLRPSHRVAVIELGMNHPGEIAALARIAAPTVALVNNAQREHQEFMASVEAVARENGQVIEALADDGIAVFPADDVHAPLWRELAGRRRVLRFAARGSAEITALAAWSEDHWSMLLDTPIGPAPVRLRAAGTHNLHNALAAAACALGAGCPLEAIREGLQAFEPVKGRSQLKRLTRGAATLTLVDDSYNANPDSVRAAIDVLAGLPRPRWLVLGDMGEVGDRGPAFHAEVGAYALQRGIESFWCAGELMRHAAAAFGAGARHHDSVEALVAGLPQAPAYNSVLVKGSRFMRMERVVAALMQEGAHAA
ncbi:MAG: UDP-N-acetylmuramoyl-tripeptide--D-alanyl-D-alanine ligase [Piscinibacter sp.]|nr:UDP-N-acetylmuramoyl-tripeptide--D-alanyl-D-alanine ligase [Piscinibacter sp.]